MCGKMLLISTIALLLCGGAQAQTSKHLADTVSGGHMSIVRSYGNDKAITFFWQLYDACLEMVDLTTGQTQYVKLPDGINIRDMVVDNDILYFCGTTASRYQADWAGHGIIGYIGLDLFWQVQTLYLSYIIDTNTTNFNKLAMYDDGGLAHVVAIGEKQWTGGNYTHSQYFFFNCYDFLQPGVNYDLVSLDVDERPWDVVLTDQYVVCFGYHADPSVNSIYFRKTYKYNIFSPEFLKIHFYTPGDDSYSRTHTIAMEKDTIITSYLSIDYTPHTRIRTIDVATGVITHAQRFDIPDKSEPWDLVYSPTQRMGVLMEDFDWGGQMNSNFVYFDPRANTSYSSILEYRPGIQFWSMTLLDLKFYLAEIGSEWFYKDMSTPPTGLPDPQCPEKTSIDIDPIDELKPNTLDRVPWVRNYFGTMNVVTDVTTQSNASIICTDN